MRSLLSILDTMEWSKKPSHATVLLKGLSSEMFMAESGINRQVFLKGLERGGFQKNPPSSYERPDPPIPTVGNEEPNYQWGREDSPHCRNGEKHGVLVLIVTVLKASSRTLQQRGAFFAPLRKQFTAPLGIFSKLHYQNLYDVKKVRKQSWVHCWQLGGAESLKGSHRTRVGLNQLKISAVPTKLFTAPLQIFSKLLLSVIVKNQTM